MIPSIYFRIILTLHFFLMTLLRTWDLFYRSGPEMTQTFLVSPPIFCFFPELFNLFCYTATNLILLLKLQSCVRDKKINNSVSPSKPIYIFHSHDFSFMYFTWFPGLLLTPNSPETPRHRTALSGYVISDMLAGLSYK